MQVVDLKQYNAKIDNSVDNYYKTDPGSLKQPMLAMLCGIRFSGKGYLTAQFLKQDAKIFNEIFLISPSYESNRSYYEKYIPPENVFKPTRFAIDQVMARVDEMRDEWENYLKKVKAYKEYLANIKDNKFQFTDDELLCLSDLNFFSGPPEYKYKMKGREAEPPTALLILDDVLGSDVFGTQNRGGGDSGNSNLVSLATLNRHVAPLEEEWRGKDGRVRTSCGLAVLFSVQTYSSQKAVSRTVRENVTDLILWKNKQKGQMDKIKDEVCSIVDEELFDQAYNEATSSQYGCLCISMKPKCKSLTFRKGLSHAIKFKELPCTCNGEFCKK